MLLGKHFAKLASEELPAVYAGESVHRVEFSGNFVSCQMFFGECKKSGIPIRAVPARPPYDGGNGNLTAMGMGNTEDGNFCDVRVFEEGFFDLGRIDFPAGHDDHVLFAVGQAEAVVVIEIPDVAGEEPAVRKECTGGFLRHVPVSFGDRRTPEGDLARCSGGKFTGSVGLINDLYFREADRMSHTLEPVGGGVILRPDDGTSTDYNRLRKAVGVDDRDVVAVMEVFPDFVMQGAAAGDDLADGCNCVFGSGGGFHQ